MVRVEINGRTLQYQPGGKFSGFSWFEKRGFILGDEAFRSEEELKKTILHELHRVTTSTILSGQNGISQNLATKETLSAYKFAEQAYKEFK